MSDSEKAEKPPPNGEDAVGSVAEALFWAVFLAVTGAVVGAIGAGAASGGLSWWEGAKSGFVTLPVLAGGAWLFFRIKDGIASGCAIIFWIVVGLFVFFYVLPVVMGIGGLAAILAFLASLG